MTRLGIGFVGAVALASIACAGSTRSGKAGTSGGSTIATAAESGERSAPGGTTTPMGGTTSAPATSDSASAGSAKREVEGRVELIDRANNVTLAGTESVGRAFDKFKIDEDTEITVNGERATVSDVQPGDEVRASFSGEGDELRLERIEILSSSE